MSAGHENTTTASSASTKNTMLASITPGDVCRVLIAILLWMYVECSLHFRPDQEPVVWPKIAPRHGACRFPFDGNAQSRPELLARADGLSQVSDRSSARFRETLTVFLRQGIQVMKQGCFHAPILPISKPHVNTRRQFIYRHVKSTMDDMDQREDLR